MTPVEIFSKIRARSADADTVICNLHSACSPKKRKAYRCLRAGSETHVIDFDAIKTLADIARGTASRKSVDALTLPPSHTCLCFIELKSWELLIEHGGTTENIYRQAGKYASDLPQKLSDSLQICKEITDDTGTFRNCKILYVLLTDIAVDDDGIAAFSSDMMALAGTSSNLKELCNLLSFDIMRNIPSVETRYWECRNFDKELSSL